MSDNQFDAEFLSEGEEYPNLGPAYFDARKVAERCMANFQAEHFKPLVDDVTTKINDAIWTAVQDSMLADVEMNLQGEMWRMVDNCVTAILGGSRWALEKYALGSRYDCDQIRAAVAKHIPAEIQVERVADLEAEVKLLKERCEIMERRY